MALDQIDVDEIENKEKNMSFLGHLDELRGHLFRSAIAVVGLSIVAFILAKEYIFEGIIFAPMQSDFITFELLCKLSHKAGMEDILCLDVPETSLQITTFLGEFLTHLKVSFIFGFIIAFPYILFQIWRFVKPALSHVEIKYARGLVASCSFLFFMGVGFGYFIIVPLANNFLASYKVIEQARRDVHLGSYMDFLISIVIASGLLFEMPIFAYFFSKIGILTAQLLKQYRKHAIVVILVVSAIVTPPDVLSQVLLSLPLYALYELSILISARVNNKRLKDE